MAAVARGCIATLRSGGHYPRLHLGLLWSGGIARYTGGALGMELAGADHLLLCG